MIATHTSTITLNIVLVSSHMINTKNWCPSKYNHVKPLESQKGLTPNTPYNLKGDPLSHKILNKLIRKLTRSSQDTPHYTRHTLG